ncbi:hypothetical protein EVAR_33664_1 [Eumeta japonica]|uniref:Uncharacterized protein n=1 Tax=Eumeta variegata TaxID=151549 RepID=A0A4C1VPK1_EUMVA|nr:hypothetical protein EVAR_33664_1 [Eumeta japonica]
MYDEIIKELSLRFLLVLLEGKLRSERMDRQTEDAYFVPFIDGTTNSTFQTSFSAPQKPTPTLACRDEANKSIAIHLRYIKNLTLNMRYVELRTAPLTRVTAPSQNNNRFRDKSTHIAWATNANIGAMALARRRGRDSALCHTRVTSRYSCETFGNLIYTSD